MSFIHLHLHTEYSLVDGLIKITDLASTVANMNMPAISITEKNNVFSAIKFYRAMRNQGIKPLIGADLNLVSEKKDEFSNILLLCQHIDGYKNLSKLITKSYNDGLIVIDCADNGNFTKIFTSNDNLNTNKTVENLLSLFPNRYYLELQRIGRKDEDLLVSNTLDYSEKFNIPVVATNNVRFLEETSFEAHEARVCIHQGFTLDDPRRPREYTDQQYVRSSEEMEDLFSDIPEAITNSFNIAQRCNVEFNLGKNFLPYFPVDENETQDQRLINESTKKLNEILSEYEENTELQSEEYHQRLQKELDVITSMGFSGYFLMTGYGHHF